MTHQEHPRSGEGNEFEVHSEALHAQSGAQGRSELESAERDRGVNGVAFSHSSHTTATSALMRLRGRSRVVRLALSATTLVALAAIVAGAFVLTRGGSGALGSFSIPLAGSRPTATAIPRETPTPSPIRVIYPTPTLAQGTPTALGPVPASCTPTAPTPRTLPTNFSGAIGASPVWVARFDGPQATQHIQVPGPRNSRYGWKVAIFFAIEPGHIDPVTIRGTRLDDGTSLWMAALEPGQTLSQATPSVAVVLDPQQPGLADFQNTSFGLSEDWAAWYGAFYIPAAGCYALEASWPGGSWHITFAAGR